GNHRWNLIDQRLTKAGREPHERVASFEDRDHRRFLLGPKPLDAESPARRPPAHIEQAHGMASRRQDGVNPSPWPMFIQGSAWPTTLLALGATINRWRVTRCAGGSPEQRRQSVTGLGAPPDLRRRQPPKRRNFHDKPIAPYVRRVSA